MSHLIQLGSEEDGMVPLLRLLEVTRDFTGNPTPICYAESTSTRDGNFDRPPVPVLESVVPVPDLLDVLHGIIVPQLEALLVPIKSQFLAIVHPASTTLPFKRHHYREKDNESQFEQENLAPVFKIMASHMAHDQIKKETRRVPEYVAVFKRCWSGLKASPYHDSFAVKAVIEVKTTVVLTKEVFGDVTGWYYSDPSKQFVPGMAIQYVWPEKLSSNTTDDAGGAGSVADRR
ncbi:hypothetical protein C0995_002363 [Termitomyces sp. Mi166|nr:hypothetical protein C0995_002363 [Termitomyces sp. Mi166\